MKTISTLLLITASVATMAQDFTQTFLNQNWVTINGLPDQIDWSASVVDDQRNLYITGNKSTVSEGTNLTLTKFDRNGNLLWEEEYNNPTDGNDYGTALIIDGSGDIIVVGTSFDLQNNNHDYTILKFEDDGTLLWSEHFNGAANSHDIASSVTVNSSNDIYVTGGSVGSTTLVDYCTLKYSSAGEFKWEARYDHQNMYDGAVSVKMSGSNIVVTGGSGNDWTDGDIATVTYNSSGDELSVRREDSAGTGFDQPYDLVVDDAGNIYVTGKVSTTTQGTNIKTIKLDEDLELIWVKEFDGQGLNDEGRSIALDDLGNVYVTGTITKPGGGSNIIIIKYSDEGAQLWVKQQHTVPTYMHAKGLRIAYNEGMLVVCGEREREGGTVVTTLGYNPEGKMQFMQNFKSDSSSNHLVHSLSLFENNIYVHGITQQTGGDKYFALKYHYHVKESEYLYESGVPRRVKKELIIGFHPDLMKLDKIDHDHFMFAELNDFVDQYAISCISSKTGIDFSKQIATKIFPECHSWDTISTSRLGKPVPIPKFWSMILVELPEAANDSILLDSILACSKYVDFASFNGIGQYANCPPNDPNYQSDNQAGFASTLLTPDVHVNIEEAWCFVSGSPEIKVGVLDSGIQFNHEDLHDEPGSESYVGSDVAGGYYVLSSQLPAIPVEDLPVDGEFETDYNLYFHGSVVAGIISARRDNDIGVAGIAGKNELSDGILLYDMRIGFAFPAPATFVNRAFYIAATDENQDNPNETFPTDANIGLGLDIINCSFTNTQALDYRKVVEYCFRNDVVIVAASGNVLTGDLTQNQNDLFYPASYRDEWILKVGANDNTGGRAAAFSVYDNDLDFIAPGVNDIYQSLAPSEGTEYNDPNDYSSYTSTDVNMVPNPFQGTSFAAPHVTGIVALMKSYVDTHPDAPNKLSAEDVQHIMKNDDGVSDPYFYDVIPPVGYDVETGFGRPNAGKILEKLQLPCYKVRHFEGSVQANTAWVSEGPTDVNIGSNQTALSTNLPFGFPTLNYNATRYKVTHTIPHNLQGGEVINYWKRDAASNLAPITSLLPGEGIDVTIESFSETSATISGYIYHIFIDQTEQYWWPIEPTDEAIFAYSVYTFSPGEVPCITTSITEEESVRANIYPNPAFDQVYVEWSEWKNTSNLQVFNTIGELVSEHIITGQRGTIAVSHLSSGMYYFVLWSDDETRTFKIVKR